MPSIIAMCALIVAFTSETFFLLFLQQPVAVLSRPRRGAAIGTALPPDLNLGSLDETIGSASGPRPAKCSTATTNSHWGH